jgi:hypothetical protein
MPFYKTHKRLETGYGSITQNNIDYAKTQSTYFIKEGLEGFF